jgi:hypothetical protein
MIRTGISERYSASTFVPDQIVVRVRPTKNTAGVRRIEEQTHGVKPAKASRERS